MKKYFGTDGIRGTVGNFPITPDFALKLGYAIGKVLIKNSVQSFNKTPSVLIGKDTRSSGYLFESSLEAGLSYAGVNVYMAGPIPTPAVAYLTRALHLSLGIVISASHNPYTDNGIKFFSSQGTKLPDEIELAIESELELPMVKAEHLGKVKRLEDVKGRYIEFCKSTFPSHLDLKQFKIVLDCANGATYQVAPSVFRELGAEVIEVASNPNGVNINLSCGTTYPNFLIESLKAHQAHLGIAFDGDGDRVVIVDSQGRLYDGDKIIYIISKLFLHLKKPIPGIVGTVMSNLALEKALNQNGIKLVRAQVGDRYVMEELTKLQWVLGGEASGHILCLDKHSTGDGIIAALQALATIIELNTSVDKLIDFEDLPQILINVKLVDRKANWEQKALNIIEEAKYQLKNTGRVIVRASGTEPLVRVMVEAQSMTEATNWARNIASHIA